jgi:uncharacterized protein YjiS (DUF1127 family)
MMMQLRQDDFVIDAVATPVGRTSATRGWLARIADAFAAWRRQAERHAAERRAIESLGRIDPHLLRDIGLTRDAIARRVRGEQD